MGMMDEARAGHDLYAQFDTTQGIIVVRLFPKDAPKTVVYPFGGGDAMGALATYPDATEYTTISLEIAADVRKATGAPRPQLRAELAAQLQDV